MRGLNVFYAFIGGIKKPRFIGLGFLRVIDPDDLVFAIVVRYEVLSLAEIFAEDSCGVSNSSGAPCLSAMLCMGNTAWPAISSISVSYRLFVKCGLKLIYFSGY
ncbi:hypothetical protein [Flavobacterium sp.]|uniref:hypothetical protein n=1 Tax=Flavobacterium sp. TaxID=239 RepID=UPI003264B6F0